LATGLLITSCDDTRIYEKNHDFTDRYWVAKETPTFDFNIQDTTQRYNLILNLRNSVSYPYARIFVDYTLSDSVGHALAKELLNEYLFDVKTGKPAGSSGLGDIYDHQFVLLENFNFGKHGKYKVSFEQFMRTDTLQGVLAIGLRVETSTQQKIKKPAG
jgi:gliding motility-associated lipoprotein GldH